MSTIKSKVKKVLMSSDDRLLLDQGVIETDGSLTTDGKDLLWDVLLKAHKAELVELLKKVADEEKAKK